MNINIDRDTLSDMDIISYYHEQVENDILPHPLRCLMVASSGGGKTNLLLNFIYNKHGIEFKNLYIFSKSLHQQAYVDLQEYYNDIEKRFKTKRAYFFNNCEDLPPPEKCAPNSLVVFDDCLTEKQDRIKDYFIRGRHKKLSCIYLSQSYGRVDMQVIRNNVNFLCIFKQNKHYMRRIYEDFVGSDMSFHKFEEICKSCWNEPYGFLSINMKKKPHNGKYMFKLKDIIIP